MRDRTHALIGVVTWVPGGSVLDVRTEHARHTGQRGSLVIRSPKREHRDTQKRVKFHDREGGAVPYRVREAVLWGVHMDVHREDGLTITAARGLYGTYYEVEVRNLWQFWRLHAVLALLPPNAVYREPEGWEEDDGESGFIVQYWEDAKDRARTTGGTWPPTPIR